MYPIITISSEDPAELRSFVKNRLVEVAKIIQDAQFELQERINSSLHLEPRDTETNQKLAQVVENLQSIKVKFDTVNSNYEVLVQQMVSFFDSIVTTKRNIEDYFADTNQQRLPEAHEKFRQDTMEEFRKLISMSETIIQRIREQEPEQVKEQDTDRIITLLEHLRKTFESQADTKQTELMEYHALNQFKVDIRRIHSSLDELTKKMYDLSQLSENSEDPQAISAATRQFEILEEETKV